MVVKHLKQPDNNATYKGYDYSVKRLGRGVVVRLLKPLRPLKFEREVSTETEAHQWIKSIIDLLEEGKGT